MSSTGSNPFGAAFQRLVSLLVGDVLAIAKPILLTTSANIKANPDPQNALAQLLLAEASLSLSGPTLEKDAIGQGADALETFANSLPG